MYVMCSNDRKNYIQLIFFIVAVIFTILNIKEIFLTKKVKMLVESVLMVLQSQEGDLIHFDKDDNSSTTPPTLAPTTPRRSTPAMPTLTRTL